MTRLTLEQIFGPDSQGNDAAERARTSANRYVRSQVQIAQWNERAKGRTINAREALRDYGLDVLETVASEGAATLVSKPNEPSATLKSQREMLGMSLETLARRTGLDVETLRKAETRGELTPIRDLERIAVELSLDERQVSTARMSGDRVVAQRLRDLNREGLRDERLVGTLAKAAWIISREGELRELLKKEAAVWDRVQLSHDYRYPTFERGYMLAARARKILGLDDASPIASVQDLVETVLRIPLVAAPMGKAVIGATLQHGQRRGIAISHDLFSERNVLQRRMTIAHEIGHLLWDPQDRLDVVQIDDADTLTRESGDAVEIRANAFAIAFLAPIGAVKLLAKEYATPDLVLHHLVLDYGISPQAARYHVSNVRKIVADDIALPKTSTFARTRWQKNELRGNALPDRDAPHSRQFATLIQEALTEGLISEDTAKSWNDLVQH